MYRRIGHILQRRWLTYFVYAVVCMSILGVVSGCHKQVFKSKNAWGANDKRDAVNTAENMVDAMADGDFTTASSNFDQKLKQTESPDLLADIWTQIINASGPFISREQSYPRKEGKKYVVYVSCHFQRAYWFVQTCFNDKHQISSLQFVPNTKVIYPIPSYANPDSYIEQPITVHSGNFELPGILTMPIGKGPYPIIVFSHSMQANLKMEDRDGTAGINKPLQNIAQGLATQGIASLRYDKRMYVLYQKEHKKFVEYSRNVHEEVIDDLNAAIKYAQKTRSVDKSRIYVLAQKYGGYLIPMIAASHKDVRGYINLSGNTRNLEDVVLAACNSTFMDNDGGKDTLDRVRREVKQIKALTPASSGSEVILGRRVSFWQELKGYNPAEQAKRMSQPMLIVFGTRTGTDIMPDYNLWKQTLGYKTNVTLRNYPDLNEMYMSGSTKSSTFELWVPGIVSKKLVDDICTWVKKH